MCNERFDGKMSVRWGRSFLRMIAGRNEGIAGVAGVEFAFFATLLTLLTVSALEFGMAFYRKVQVYDAAQAGAEYVIKNGYVASSVLTAVTSASAFLLVTASPAPSQSGGSPTTSGITAA